MKSWKNLALGGVFALSALAMAAPQEAQAQALSQKKIARDGDRSIKTSYLSVLKGEDGKPYDMNRIKGKFLLVYFGTAYSNPSCSSFFNEIGFTIRLLKENCGLRDDDFRAVFVCPYTKGETNQTSLKRAKNNNFEILRGDLNVVKNVAGKFRTLYLGDDGRGNPVNHTNTMLFQDRAGQNTYILVGYSMPLDVLPHLSREMREDGLKLDCYY